MPSHFLANFRIQKYYQNEPKFNGVYSRDNLPKIKDGAYVINLDEFKSIGTHYYYYFLLLFIYSLLTIVKIYNKNLHIKNVATPDLVC